VLINTKIIFAIIDNVKSPSKIIAYKFLQKIKNVGCPLDIACLPTLSLFAFNFDIGSIKNIKLPKIKNNQKTIPIIIFDNPSVFSIKGIAKTAVDESKKHAALM
jgi:hypothetical protein